MSTALCCALVSGAANAVGERVGPWLGFRYSDQEVLVYIDQMRDLQTHSMDEVYRSELPNVRAKWGGGGYLLPLTAERLSHFEPLASSQPVIARRMPKGTRVTVQITADQSIEGVVDRIAEQWGLENPSVRIAVIVKIGEQQLATLQAAPSDYFLVALGPMRDVPVADASGNYKGPRRVLNDLGPRGQIIVDSAEAGWQVALWRKTGGMLRRTQASYTYGD